MEGESLERLLFNPSKFIDFSVANALPAEIETPQLAPIAAGFAENVDLIHTLLVLPTTLLLIGEVERSHLEVVPDAMTRLLRLGVVDLQLDTKEGASRFHNAVAEIMEEKKAEHQDEAARRVRARLPSLIGNLRPALQTLVYSCLAYGWAAFESAVKEAWAVALNCRPTQLAARALQAVPGEDAELSSKSLPVGLLARHGFNLTSCMGTLLAPKFDFTGVSGLQKAYGAAFGNVQSIKDALMDPKLADAEATRHLIVHRAGRVDAEFRKRTGSKLPDGARLSLDLKDLGAMVTSIIQSGSALIRAVDQELLRPSERGAGG